MSIDFDKIHQTLKIDEPEITEKTLKTENRSVRTKQIEVKKAPEKKKEVVKAEVPLTRRTFKYPTVYDLALSELQDRENIRRRRAGEKGKFNSEDTIELVFKKLFEMKEYADCLEAAEKKMNF